MSRPAHARLDDVRRLFLPLEEPLNIGYAQARTDRAESGNLGDCRPVGEGVSEMRIDVGQGYRVYFLQRGAEVIVLLAGRDRSTQEKDIAGAQRIARQV